MKLYATLAMSDIGNARLGLSSSTGGNLALLAAGLKPLLVTTL